MLGSCPQEVLVPGLAGWAIPSSWTWVSWSHLYFQRISQTGHEDSGAVPLLGPTLLGLGLGLGWGHLLLPLLPPGEGLTRPVAPACTWCSRRIHLPRDVVYLRMSGSHNELLVKVFTKVTLGWHFWGPFAALGWDQTSSLYKTRRCLLERSPRLMTSHDSAPQAALTDSLGCLPSMTMDGCREGGV